jgi:AcrR family transcriptional regulator
MGRPARFEKEQIVDATKRLIAEGGPRAATVSAIANRIGAPTGSIYHRYGSRELLLADLWLTVVEGFQEGLLSALRGPDPVEAGVRGALYGPAWVRAHFPEARLLLLYRREDLITGPWPAGMKKRARKVKRDLLDGMRDLTRRRYGRATPMNIRRVRFAVFDTPYGALKRYVEAGERPPPDIDALIKETCLSILAR